jgi:hypothetical protein
MDASDILSAIAVVVSLVTFGLTHFHDRRLTVLGRRPVLVFEYDGSRGWILRNVGLGPALNPIVAQKTVGGDWFNPVRIPPLAVGGEFIPLWLRHVNTTGLGVLYDDTDGLPYSATCGNDRSRVFAGHRFGPWKEDEIGRHWNHPMYRE